MAKKKKTARVSKTQNKEFISSPFSHLKGFAVSVEQSEDEVARKKPSPKEAISSRRSFSEEMSMLGVTKLNPDDDEMALLDEEIESVPEPEVAEELNDDEQFLQAMGELQVNFKDRLPELDLTASPSASARRMKQLKQGRLKPEASLDLHGCKRSEVVERLRFFLQNADRQNWRTVLVITGRGLHSVDGEPVLRNEVEAFLAAEGRKWVAEWSRAPKHFGGNGALVLFLKQIV